MELTREEIHFGRTQFHLLIYRSNGQQYQDLFVRIMSSRRAGFKTVKPHGKQGDRKNDGYEQEAGRYFQIYAPENPSAAVAAAVKKAVEDFKGLKEFWEKVSPIREYRFAFNDKYLGPYPEIETALTQLGKENGLAACGTFLAHDLLREFEQMDSAAMMDVVGLLPNPANLRSLDFNTFSEVLTFIVQTNVSLDTSQLNAANFDEKIRFNGLSKEVGTLLTHGSFQSGAVRRFFDTIGKISASTIRDALAAIYDAKKESAAVANLPTDRRADIIFFEILQDIMPHQTRQLQDAAIVLMAHFFESCDIFEAPTLSI